MRFNEYNKGATISEAIRWKAELPDGMPDDEKNIIIGMQDSVDDPCCHFCKTRLVEHERKMHRCAYCRHYFIYPGKGLASLISERANDGFIQPDIDVFATPCKVTKPIYIWSRSPIANVYKKIYTP